MDVYNQFAKILFSYCFCFTILYLSNNYSLLSELNLIYHIIKKNQLYICFFLKIVGGTTVWGTAFISSEFTDISFEVKAVLCLNFYAFGDVFRGNGIVQQNCIVGNRLELERTISKNKNTLSRKELFPIAVSSVHRQENCQK